MFSERSSKPRHREYFASPVTVAATVGSVLFFLYLVFPKESLMELLSAPHGSDPLVRNYLTALLQVEPENESVRLLLARQELGFGNRVAAKDLLKSLYEANTPALRWEALWTTYEITYNDTFSHGEETPLRRAGIVQLNILQDQLTEGPWGRKELERLARDATALGNLGAAERFLARLTQLVTTSQSAADAGAMALSVGAYRRSAEYYFLAQSRETTLSGRRSYFLAALRSLQSGNLGGEALEMAPLHMQGLENDRETILFLARLALAAQKGHLAESYLKRLLKIGG